ncbi:MAG: RNA polymerase sigma factor RpoE [Pseudomonadota bacterium]
MGESVSDNELVLRVQRGDKAAFDLLVMKYQNKVASLVGRYLREPADVADVCQEAFIKAYRGLGNFRGDSAFYTWLYRIAVNAAVNHIATRNRRPQGTSLDVEDSGLAQTVEKLHELASPDHQASTDELAETIRNAVEGLPPDLRTAITLREYDGLSYEEIATVMECPIGTVRSRIFRAREAIEAQIEPVLHANTESGR